MMHTKASSRLLVLGLALVSLCACKLGGAMPKDTSLQLADYAALGVPSPTVAWGLREYGTCMNILSSLPQRELPRYQSAKSGRLFDRMLDTHLSLGDMVLVSSDAQFKPGTPLMPQLYDAGGPEQRAHLARERLAIRDASVRALLTVAPNIQQTQDRVSELRLELENATPGRAELVRANIAGAQRLSDTIGKEIASSLIHLAAIGREKGVGNSVKCELAKDLAAIVPQAIPFLTGEERESVRGEIAATASQIGAEDIAADLSQLAKRL